MTAAITVPIRLVSEANSHTHWRLRQKRAKAQREAVSFAWGALPRGWRKPTQVVLTRIAPRKLDSDNLQGACKHVRDEVAALCGFDDRDESVTWLYAQEQAKEYGVRIEVTW